MKKKGLVGLAVFIVGVLLAVIVLPVFANTEDPSECSAWTWNYVGVRWEGGNTELHLQLVSDGPQQGHSNTRWDRCFDCDAIVSVKYETPSMDAPADAAYECEEDSDFFKIEQTIEEASADFWITIKGASAIGGQVYLSKWATNTCTGEVEWLNCGPPTAVTIRDFYAWSPKWWFARLLSWFR